MFLKKTLGQNFLTSSAVAGEMVRAGALAPGDLVLEVGPGEGVLTELLLRAGARVVAVEKDRRLIPFLNQKFAKEIRSGRLTLIESDILKLDLSNNLQIANYKLVANIPYYLTGALFKKFLSSPNQPSIMIVMVQKEVAERIMARDKKESILSISVKAYGQPKILRPVSKSFFRPRPKVDSAILIVDSISKKFFAEVGEAEFFAALRKGFSSKRKLLLSNLGVPEGERERMAGELGISPKARAEDLSLGQWQQLAKELLNVRY
ncbi:MAG: ribosomal RNA small subunit methyltransferase A [Candidatus Taylorbacteria bacterium]|nr:ribosomal RNA small subunit methyltransferase A [Candidatus Taylorbacteria bacterium]